MSARRRITASLAGRVLAVAAALSLAVGPVSAADTPYEHVWRVQGEVGGELGGKAERRVTLDEVELRRDGEKVTGTVSYADRLAVTQDAGFFGQVSEIELVLTGTMQGTEAAGGTFEGDVRLYEPKVDGASALFGLSSGSLARAPLTTYSVSGRWGTRIRSLDAAGELLFEDVRKLRGGGAARDAAWFNRLSLENPDELGDAQRFRTVMQGDAPAEQPTDGDPAVAEDDGAGFVEYVRRGLSGSRRLLGMPSTPERQRSAHALRDAAPEGATALPEGSLAIDLDVSGQYLDAKNRAAGLLAADFSVTDADEARAVWEDARSTGGLPMPLSGTDRVAYYVKAIEDAANRSKAQGVAELKSEIDVLVGSPAEEPEKLRVLRTWAMTALAASGEPTAGAPAPAAAIARRVEGRPIPQEGAQAEAVRAAAGDPRAPVRALVVTRFARERAQDAPAGARSLALPARVLDRHGTRTGESVTLSWGDAERRGQVAPDAWLAYRRGDGRTFWLAGAGGEVALTEQRVSGWAYSWREAWLVEAGNAAKPVASFALGR